ncbi:hypothetical protein QE152_g37715 [Popillia japonica]|uniref:Uncharacterized protein n=1 Tax=Popillia japonica TaxID=7064 RepID=A0AAW1I9M9_POPJA
MLLSKPEHSGVPSEQSSTTWGEISSILEAVISQNRPPASVRVMFPKDVLEELKTKRKRYGRIHPGSIVVLLQTHTSPIPQRRVLTTKSKIQ